jgi:hypothetical protein
MPTMPILTLLAKARGVAVAGEDRRAVAVGVVVHQPDRRVAAKVGARRKQNLGLTGRSSNE